jgi:hypothetical protein
VKIVEASARTLLVLVGQLQLERQRLRSERASHEELERNRRELASAEHDLAVALGAEHSSAAGA